MGWRWCKKGELQSKIIKYIFAVVVVVVWQRIFASIKGKFLCNNIQFPSRKKENKRRRKII